MTEYFTGGFSNNWRDAQNWGVAIPGQFSEVFIDSGSVLVTGSGIAQKVFVGTGQPAQLNIQDGNFSVSKGLVVGEFGNVEINGGISQIDSMTVNGLRDDLENTFSGRVNVSGGSLQTNNIVLGEIAGTYGELSVAGGDVLVAQVIAGQGIGALGTIGVTDGVLRAETFKLGVRGSGSVGQSGGYITILKPSTDQVGKLTLGDGEEGTGEYTLAGGELNLSSGELHISSTGSFEHSGGHLTNVGSVLNDGVYTVSGGTFSANHVTLGNQDNAIGTLNLSGGTTNINKQLVLGGTAGAQGTLNVSGTYSGAGATVVAVSGPTIVGRIQGTPSNEALLQASGALNIDGGTFTTHGVIAGQGIGALGTIGVSDGTFEVEALTLGGSVGATGELSVSGGSFAATTLAVGPSGHGAIVVNGPLNLTAGTADRTFFTAHDVTVGNPNESKAAGSLTLSGGTTDISGELILSGAGESQSTLNVSGNALVNLSGSTIVGQRRTEGSSHDGMTYTGDLNISGGSVIAAQVIAGQGIGAFGTIGFSGGSFQADSLTLGSGGNAAGSVTQTGGNFLFQEAALFDSSSALTVGDGKEATGEYTLAGGVLNLSGGEIHISSTGSFEHSGGHLTNVGNVLNEGVYNVGVSKNGELAMSNVVEFTQTTAGTLSIQLAGPDGFRSGLATSSSNDPASTWGFGFIFAGGELRILPGENYTDPATRGTADDIVLIEAGNIVGAFDTVNYAGESLTIDFADEDGISFRSHVDNGLFRNVTYTATTVELQNLLAIEGDTDGDGDDDTYDLTQMIMNFTGATGNGKTWITGDIDDDGDTDTYDLTRAIINFTGARNSATAIPEPSGLLLLVLAIGCLASARGRSYHREI